jgi:hypothetical protein
MRTSKLVLALVLALLVAFGIVGVAIAAVPTDTSALRNAVTVAGIMEHEQAFQNIATSNGGTRVSGTSGYDASADYVVDKLTDAGYNVKFTRDAVSGKANEFDYLFFQELTPTTFSRTAPTAKAYVDGTDFHIMSYSGSADVVDAPVVPTNDIQILPDSPENTSTSGCQLTDFEDVTSVPEDQVALIQRGGAPQAATSRRKRGMPRRRATTRQSSSTRASLDAPGSSTARSAGCTPTCPAQLELPTESNGSQFL